MNKIRTIFMGTPVFACAILEQLYQETAIEVIAVVSQPDRKVGRKQLMTPTPIKELALKHGTPVYQPERLKQEVDVILALPCDLIITCAYGQMIPDVILAHPHLGCYNVHASLLPKLRGGAPIHKAIMFSQSTTGITIMEMVHKMDAGDMISQAEITIEDTMTMGDLHDALMPVGAKLLHDTLPSLLDQSYSHTAQNEAEVTFAWNISKEEECIDLSKPYRTVYDHIRSLIPSPVGYVRMEGKKVKLWGARMTDQTSPADYGTVLGFDGDGMLVAVDHRVLRITALQVEGKQRISAHDFKNGAGKTWIGRRFDESAS